MQFVNLTPHSLHVRRTDGSMETIFPDLSPARVDQTVEPLEVAEGFQISRRVFGEVKGLPLPAPGVIYVVSALVADTVRRPDVVSPGELLRDEKGQIIGSIGFFRSC